MSLKGIGSYSIGGINAAMEFFGDGSDGELTSGQTFTANENDLVIKQYESVNLSSGTVTVDTPCKGLVIYSKSDIVIDGTIDMSEKASVNAGGDINLPIGNTIKNIAVTGGAGGDGGYGGGYSDGTGRSSGGNGGTGRINVGGFGAGGGGGVAGDMESVRGPGGNGGSILSQNLGGGREIPGFTSDDKDGDYFLGRYGINGSGGTGGLRYVTGTTEIGSSGACNGAGGGGSGGATGTGASSQAGTDGGYAGGCVILIAKGNIIINGYIKCKGGDGGDGGNGDMYSTVSEHWVTGGGGGGGAGGGTISIFHKGSYTNNGSLQVNGGDGGLRGAAYYETLTYKGEYGGIGSSGSDGTVYTEQL